MKYAPNWKTCYKMFLLNSLSSPESTFQYFFCKDPVGYQVAWHDGKMLRASFRSQIHISLGFCYPLPSRIRSIPTGGSKGLKCRDNHSRVWKYFKQFFFKRSAGVGLIKYLLSITSTKFRQLVLFYLIHQLSDRRPCTYETNRKFYSNKDIPLPPHKSKPIQKVQYLLNVNNFYPKLLGG